ncbi:MAG TPA: SDR family oxidoreductase [Thermoleophilaceae bacterium]
MRLASRYAGTHALVTGGSGGIGLALARRLVDLGAGVTLVARSAEGLARAEDELRRVRSGAEVRTISLDVSDEEVVADVFPRELGGRPVDLLVNCAGVSSVATFLEAEPAGLRDEMDVNYFGAVWVTRAIVPGMLDRGRGHVLNVGSTASLIGIWGYSAYTPPKFALYGLSEVLRAELRPRGVGVSIVLPTSTRTPMLDRELAEAPPETRRILLSTRVLEPDRVAEAALRGAARGRFEIVPGPDVRLSIWAYRTFPRVGRALLDREARRAR